MPSSLITVVVTKTQERKHGRIIDVVFSLGDPKNSLKSKVVDVG